MLTALRTQLAICLHNCRSRREIYVIVFPSRLLKYEREGNAGILAASSSGHPGCTTGGQDARMTGQTGSLSYASPGYFNSLLEGLGKGRVSLRIVLFEFDKLQKLSSS